MLAGYVQVLILRVTNNTKEDISDIKFFYKDRNDLVDIKIKKLKANKQKQTGIATMNVNGNNLYCEIEGKLFLIKENVLKGDLSRYEVIIQESEIDKVDIKINKIEE
ncbi:MAG: hypothetical protein ACRDDL_08035 [Sarcina sp.]